MEAGTSRRGASAAPTVHGRCASRPAGNLAIAMDCPGLPGFAGSSPALPSYSCFAAERRDAKMRLHARFGVSSPHGQPDRPAPLRPVPGRPEPRPRRRGRARARRLRALRAAGRCSLRAPRAKLSPARPPPAPGARARDLEPTAVVVPSAQPGGGVGDGACVRGASPRGAPRARRRAARRAPRAARESASIVPRRRRSRAGRCARGLQPRAAPCPALGAVIHWCFYPCVPTS